MFPHRRMPYHITVLYIYTVVNILILFHVTLVAAKVRVLKTDGTVVATFQDTELQITDDFDPNGMRGMIEEAHPPDGCRSLHKPMFFTNFTLSKFVLIAYSNCNLSTKIRNAKNAGYDAVLIYASQGREYYTLDEYYPIPVILIEYKDGLQIKKKYQYEHSYIIIIIQNSPVNVNTYLLLFAIVVGICFILMLIFLVLLIVKCIKDRRRNRRNRLSSRHLKQIPTTKFSKGDQYDVCAICLEEYNEGDKLRILPCSHAYHAKCIDPWLTNNRRTCPLCKRKIHLGDSSSDSDSDSELTSPAETTPLLQPADGRRNMWGTFAEPFNNPLSRDEREGSTTNSMQDTQESHHSFSQNGSFSISSAHTVHPELHLCVDDQCTSHFPSAHHSVNTEEDTHYTVDAVEASGQRSSSAHQGLIV